MIASVVVGLACLVVGLAIGRASAPVRVVATDAEAAEPAPPPPPKADPPARLWLRKALRERAAGLADELAVKGREEPTAAAFASMAAEGWALGVEDLREALIRSSGLPADVMDQACSVALDAIEASRSTET